MFIPKCSIVENLFPGFNSPEGRDSLSLTVNLFVYYDVVSTVIYLIICGVLFIVAVEGDLSALFVQIKSSLFQIVTAVSSPE